MVNSTEKSALTTSFSFIIQIILSNNDLYICNAIDEHYLIIHTFRGATAHSSCVAGGVANLLLICLQWRRPHGAAVHLTAISSLHPLLDQQQTVTIT
jgi:hypothetical protein